MTVALCHIDLLTIHYRGQMNAAVKGLSLDLMSGERLAIVGESGSGKSTFVRALSGLLPAGTVYDGRMQWSEGRSPRLGRDLGFVFQDASSSLNPVLRVGEQVAESARRHLGMTWPQAYGHARELLEHVRIPNAHAVMRAYPHQMSGGQRQRVAIAAAIAGRPSILIADEATSALDTVVQAEIVTLLDELVRKNAMTLIFVTHDIALASNLADRIAVFKDAHLIEIGPVADVLSNPKSGYTKSLIAGHLDLKSPSLIGGASST
ncbi:ATP-binding cassette domain-containing protein [Rhizobiales bacterium RZME27]|uniref:ATP-binding cassette domain-containing protein n=1 Tax=Endobacterium cereale TaxID=2663029 RepID=A0A6A8A9A2_9HYPH|nr:ABC transporter ATP-binding protein [Endobacterium cereale]MEB2843316.1 ABC transporter ATP-binding protein [Endobacterium cereale]MQY47274.1 ATP-binding cassette domain-containing protein [Endobacterium cereale]